MRTPRVKKGETNWRRKPERCAAEIELIRSVYPSEEFLLPEPGKEVRLTFAEGQRLLREEGPEEYRNVSDDEDMSTVLRAWDDHGGRTCKVKCQAIGGPELIVTRVALANGCI